MDTDIGQRRLGTKLTAQTDDLAAYTRDDVRQAVGTDVGFIIPKDLARRAEADKSLEDIGCARVGDAGAEFSVGERTRAALSELYIGIRVERPAAEKPRDILPAFLYGTSALAEDRTYAGTREGQRGEQSGRPRADDERTRRERVCTLPAYRLGEDTHTRTLRRTLALRRDGEYKADIPLMPSVDCPA